MDGLFGSLTDRNWHLRKVDGTTATAAPAARYRADEGAALLAAAEAAMGITCLPASFCNQAIAQGRLLRILPEWTAGTVTTTLLYPHRRGLLPSVRVVADLIVEQIAGG